MSAQHLALGDLDPSRAHALAASEVAALLGVDPDDGLTVSDAAERLDRNGPNELTRESPPSWIQRIVGEFRDPLVVLLLFAVAISVAAWVLDGAEGLPYDSIAIAAILAVNAGIGAVQAVRADSAAAALGKLAAVQARVFRCGGDGGARFQDVPAAEIVVGDVVVLTAGDAVPADARLLTAHGLATAEAALTGESHPAQKGTESVATGAFLGDRSSMVYSGTAIVAGRSTAVVVATGMHTEVGRIASMLSETERLDTPLQREIASLGRLLGRLVVVIAIVVMGVLAATSDVGSLSDVIEVLLVGVSLAVAAVPEGLPAILSVVLAISVQRMAGRNALVKRLASAETLGAATVICTDKTGTLTRSEMTVRVALVDGARADIAGVGYEPVGAVTVDGQAPSPDVRAGLVNLLRSAVDAADGDVTETPQGFQAVGSPTEAALVAASRKLGGDAAEQAERERPRLSELAFTSDRKRMSVLLDAGDSAGGVMITKGAPDVLLELCETEWTESGPVRLTPDRRGWWGDRVEALAAEGLRTLAVARRSGVTMPLVETDEVELEWLGVLGIDDPPRLAARASVEAAHESGIRVVMITGDHPGTAMRIAQLVAIADSGDTATTGDQIEAMDDAQLVEAAATTAVFARVTPAHKLRLVRALQAQGEVVAMTGDGVNDAPALKAADIGTAMGKAGTDVAREAADMILLDDNFATIVDAVSEGRTIWHNIRSFLRYLGSSNVGEVFTVFGGIVFAGVIGLSGDGILAPLTASQILWINLLTDAAPALALGVDPVDPSVMQQRPRPRDERILGPQMLRGIVVIGATMAVVTLLMFDLKRSGGLFAGSESLDYARTAAFTVLVLAQVFNSFNARSDVVSAVHTWARNRLLLAAAVLAVALQVAVVHISWLNDAFSTTPLSLADWLLCAALASVVLWVAEIRKLLLRRSSAKAAG